MTLQERLTALVQTIGGDMKLLKRSVTLTDGATVTINPAQGNDYYLETANSRIFDISGEGFEKQRFLLAVKNIGVSPITPTFTTGSVNKFRFVGSATGVQPIQPGQTALYGIRYHGSLTDQRWDIFGDAGDFTRTIGYEIAVQALTSSPADGQTIYFGVLPKAPTTTANISKVYVRKAGLIKRAEIYCYSGTAGTNEAWSLYIRKNNTTDYLIQTLSVATSERIFSNTALNSGNSIPMSGGDYFEIKAINPTWATNPLTTIFGGRIYFEESGA